MKNFINFILFQTGWFAVVASAANGQPIWGTAIIGAIIAYHLIIWEQASNELILIVFGLIVGLVWDSLMTMQGLFVYHSGIFTQYLAPYWILAMWALFGITLNHSLRWFQGKTLLASIGGAIFGPLAYYSGYRLGAVDIPNIPLAMLWQSIGWAVIFPILIGIAKLLRELNTPELSENAV